MSVQQLHTYCAMCVSRCGVVATVEDGILKKVTADTDPFLEIHPGTAKASGIEDGEWVVLETAMGRVRLKAKFRDLLDPRVVTTQYGWWQGCQELDRPSYDPFGPDGANVNLLIANEDVDPISASVPHRSQMCRVRKEG